MPEINTMNAPLMYLYMTQWSKPFEKLMRARLAMGAMRYGPIGEGDKSKYDRPGTILRKAERYKETGNDELLVDIANMALLEFVEGQHPKKHFKAADDKGHQIEERNEQS